MKDKTKVVAIIIGAAALGLITIGCWEYMGCGALAVPGFLLWADLTIWSIRK